jgi:cytochrome c oxidase cbb3-type subunit 3
MSLQNPDNHEYDGIRELDNPAPFWWNLLFIATIVFSAFYVNHYMVGDGPGLREELEAELTKLRHEELARSAGSGPDSGRLVAMVKEPDSLSKGKAVFASKCASCHGQDGGGQIGPNLTDAYWLHGDGKPMAIYAVIKDGVSEKGMPPWGALLQPAELMQVTAYVRSLRGTKPATPKAPQGTPQEE